METQILEKQKAAHPELAELLNKLIEYANSKLYHQLTETMIEYISSPCFTTGTELVDLFDQFLKPLEKKLDPVRWVYIMSVVAKQKAPDDALTFIAPFEVEKATHRDAYFLWKCLKGEKQVMSKKYEEAKENLETLGKEIDEAYDVDALVQAEFHKTYASLYKALSQPDKFFKSSLQYLAFTNPDKISEKPRVAFEITVAALVAEGEFGFGELVQQEVFKSLDGDGQFGWIMDVLTSFVEGKFEMYDEALAKHKTQIEGVPELKAGISTGGVMRRKMQQLALMDFAFRRPKKQRRLTFKEIADHCRIGINDVEALVMKTMAENLIIGKLDQVDQDVMVTWVKPRILDKDRIGMMRERMDAWANQTSMLLEHLEEMTPELLVS